MKRSEMVAKIWEFIKTIETDYDEYMKEQDCDKLLQVIEKAGMKAPLANFKGDRRGCLCTMHECCTSCGGLCNEWESE